MATGQKGFLLTRQSSDRRNCTEIVLWVVTDDQPVCLVIEGEQPVLFVETPALEQARKLLNHARVTFSFRDLELTTFHHQRVAALYFNTIDSSQRARRLLSSESLPIYEADIRLHDRYLMERFIYGPLEFTGDPIQRNGYIEYRQARVRPAQYTPSFRLISLDVECSVRGELYSIGLFGEGLATVLMIGEPPAPEPIEPVSDGLLDIHWVADERALLEALEEQVAQYDPDLFIGWNVINFDFRLLLKRAALYRMPLKLGRGRQAGRWRERSTEPGQGYVSIPGRMVIDGIDALKSATWQFDSFSLESVARELLGKG
nr:3'-5' exonuclease [Endozoicomonas sp.]